MMTFNKSSLKQQAVSCFQFHLHEEGKLDPVLYKLQNKAQV